MDVYTIDVFGNPIDQIINITYKTDLPGGYSYGSSVEILDNPLVGDSDAVYKFYMYFYNPVPIGGALKLSLSEEISMDQYSMYFNCDYYCDNYDANLNYTADTNELMITDLFNEYLEEWYSFYFTIGGFTNPKDYGSYKINVTTLDHALNGYAIDQFNFKLSPASYLTITDLKRTRFTRWNIVN